MSVDRISAVVRALSPQARPGERQPLPTPGETLLLTYDKSSGDDLLVATSSGKLLRLVGLSHLIRDLRPGDTLMARVVASGPVLELELYGTVSQQTASDAGSSTLSRIPAMRLDQAALRQIAWQVHDAATWAHSWRARALERWSEPVLTYGRSGETLPVQPASQPISPVQREPAATHPPTLIDRWMIPIFVPGGATLILRLVEGEERTPDRQPRRQRRLALQLELALPALGRIVLQAHELPEGIQLLVMIEQPDTVPVVRDALPTIASAMAKAGIHLAGIRLIQRALAAGAGVLAFRPPHGHVAADTLSPALFRTLAEAAAVLLPAGKGRVSPESR